MPEVGEVFQEVFFVEAKPPEAHEIAAAQADAVNTIYLGTRFLHHEPSLSWLPPWGKSSQLPCNTAAMQCTIVLRSCEAALSFPAPYHAKPEECPHRCAMSFSTTITTSSTFNVALKLCYFTHASCYWDQLAPSCQKHISFPWGLPLLLIPASACSSTARASPIVTRPCSQASSG